MAVTSLAFLMDWLRTKQKINKYNLEDKYDYIVVGSGSAGCVVANRLSADPETNVLLIEAGGEDTKPEIHVPLAVAALQRSDVDWKFEIESQRHACKAMKGQKCNWPRGKVVGGSSSINNMAYIRGCPADFNRWAEMGAENWAWEDILPCFEILENNQSEPGLSVTEQSYKTPMAKAFIEAGIELGYPKTPDINGKSIFGFGDFPATIRNGERCSSAKAFLEPIKRRNNLTISVNTLVTKIEVVDGRATGVHVIADGKEEFIPVGKEIILSAGTIGSPQILLLSGIGPEEDLKEVGIDCKVNLPAVGRNLQDHLALPVIATSTQGARIMLTDKYAATFSSKMKYLFQKKGMLSTNGLEAVAFLNSGMEKKYEWPDIQIILVPSYFALGIHQFSVLNYEERYKTDLGYDIPEDERKSFEGITLAPVLLHPKSNGFIKLSSADPTVPPIIQPNYLSDQRDVNILAKGLEICQKIAATEAMKPFGLKLDLPDVTDTQINKYTDEYREQFVRHIAATIYHPTGTCRMGAADDPSTVVDPKLRVKGVVGLRVADASIMPEVTSGNTNAPSIMIGQKAATIILSET
ncbi:alcohol dehydrogenase [acceptor]-like [Antedon mediterranea]|uniref:alcohol dehydrogenase [acceptor]-like n=1 Tax=Antedon mediterranea TaxID=105859 RepID=UPI003AF6F565